MPDPTGPQYTPAQLRQIADGYFKQFLMPSSMNVPPESMIMACQIMIAGAAVAIMPPEASSFTRGHEIGNEIAGMIDTIRRNRAPQQPPANDSPASDMEPPSAG